MCLIFDGTKPPFEGEATLYKVYCVYYDWGDTHPTLMSPVYRHAPGGYMSSGGEKIALVTGARPSGRGGEMTPYGSFPQDWSGRSLDASGFHCFARKEDAEQYIEKELNERYNSNARRVVVPVRVRSEDVLAVGETPYGYDKTGKTYVVKRITINQADFDAAVKR